MNSNNTFEIIAPVSSLSNRTRLYKLACYVLNDKKISKIHHVAWVRDKSEAQEEELLVGKVKTTPLINFGGYGRKLTKLLYLLWMIRVFLYCLFRKEKAPVWALGFETAFPALIASKIRNFDIIFDDADRFSLVYPFPNAVKRIIQKLERYTSENVRLHVIPGKERYDFYHKNCFILKNTPSKAELEKAKKLFLEHTWPQAKLIINVNGWLGKDRGMDAALHIANTFSCSEVHLLVSGKVDCTSASKLVMLDNVTYLGKVSNAMALASYMCSDYVLTYYDPSIEINTLAQSNKWGDALSMGVNIIVNSEVTTAKFLHEVNDTIHVLYQDHQSLIAALRSAIIQRKNITKNKVTIVPIDTYEQQLTNIFNKVHFYAKT